MRLDACSNTGQSLFLCQVIIITAETHRKKENDDHGVLQTKAGSSGIIVIYLSARGHQEIKNQPNSPIRTKIERMIPTNSPQRTSLITKKTLTVPTRLIQTRKNQTEDKIRIMKSREIRVIKNERKHRYQGAAEQQMLLKELIKITKTLILKEIQIQRKDILDNVAK